MDGEPRRIRRALTAAERTALERRRDELAPVMAPVGPTDEKAAEALSDMLGSFQGSKATGAEALAKIESLMRLLAEFPLWAIEAVCHRIRTNGYEVVDRDGVRRERHWPPADAEIVAEMRREVRLRQEALDSATALLAAQVDA